MKVLFVNDTFDWGGGTVHWGCKAVCDSLCSRLEAAGHRIIVRVYKPFGPTPQNVDACEMMVVNGEGMMRRGIDGYDLQRQRDIHRGLVWAQEQGKPTYLVNTVWYRQPDWWGDVIGRLTGLSVREPASAVELERQFGVTAEVHLDESYFAPVVCEPIQEKYDVLVGTFYPHNLGGRDENCPLFAHYPKMSLLRTPWAQAVETLRRTRLYVTGQHHGVYAACRARCLFAAAQVQTHKLTGLFEWAGVNIPLAPNVSRLHGLISWASTHQEMYQKLFDFMEKQAPWPIPK